MSKNTFQFIGFTFAMLMLFSGCAERGYHLTRQSNTHTITAQSNVDIHTPTAHIKHKLQQMQTAIKKEQKKTKKETLINTITEIKARKNKHNAQREATRKKAKLQKIQDFKREKETEEKARQTKIPKEAQIKKAEEIKRKELKKFKEKQKLKAEEEKEEEAKALEIAKRQKQKAKEEQEKRIEEKRKQEEAQRKRLEAEKKAKMKHLQAQKEKENQLRKSQKANTTEPLKFHLINNIYHKYGTSEIHGHVIYLNGSGEELRLSGAKVYLLPVSAKLNYWFNNYYLKNRLNPKTNSTTVNYLNTTILDFEKNFAFYGVAEGGYYIIIEAPHYTSKGDIDKNLYCQTNRSWKI